MASARIKNPDLAAMIDEGQLMANIELYPAHLEREIAGLSVRLYGERQRSSFRKHKKARRTPVSASTLRRKLDLVVQQLVPSGELLDARQLQGGISAEMTALDIRRADGTTLQVIVRRPGESTYRKNPHAARDEFRILQLTRSFGISSPPPLYLDDSRTIFSTPYLVVEYIHGEPDFAPRDLSNFVRQFASHLATIHRIQPAIADLDFLSRRTIPFPELARPATPDLDPAFQQSRIRNLLNSAPSSLPKNPPSLVHGDYWQGNLLWRDGRLVAVIDWEDAAVDDPLYDVAISRLDLFTISGRPAMDLFTRTYQSVMPLDFTPLPYWDMNAALRLARLAGPDLNAWAAFFPPFGRSDITAQTILADYQAFVAQAVENARTR